MVLTLTRIPEKDLYKSEPPPEWFGNDDNKGLRGGWTNENWLKSRFHFSFAEYRDPKNTNFGCLRVLNDDLVQGERGFGRHPHRDVEIVTYIVEGNLTHADSTGTRETLGRGSVQFMTAGRGIYHSEHNLDKKPLRFVQIWINTRQSGLPPVYGGFDGSTEAAKAARHNQFAQLVGDNKKARDAEVPVRIAQDCTMHASEIDAGQTVDFTLGPHRQAYFVCLEGSVTVARADSDEKVDFQRHDASEIRGEGKLSFTASNGPAHVLLLDMEATGGGRGPGRWPLHIG